MHVCQSQFDILYAKRIAKYVMPCGAKRDDKSLFAQASIIEIYQQCGLNTFLSEIDMLYTQK